VCRSVVPKPARSTSVIRRTHTDMPRATWPTGRALLPIAPATPSCTPFTSNAEAQGAVLREYFAIDLLMDDDGTLRGLLAWCLEDGSLHRFRANTTVIATGGCGRVYQSCTSAHTCTGTAAPWCCARGCRCRTWSSFSFTDGRVRRGRSDHRRGARRRRYLTNSEGERFMPRYAPREKGSLLARCGEPCRGGRDSRGPRRWPKKGSYHLHWASPPTCSIKRLRASCSPRVPLRRRRSQRTDPVIPTCTTSMGGIPDQYQN